MHVNKLILTKYLYFYITMRNISILAILEYTVYIKHQISNYNNHEK